jgi:hypothetical protein
MIEDKALERLRCAVLGACLREWKLCECARMSEVCALVGTVPSLSEAPPDSSFRVWRLRAQNRQNTQNQRYL